MEEYIQIEQFYRGYAKVRNSDGLKGVINKNNELLIPCKYKHIEYFFNKLKQSFVLVKNLEDKWGCLNKKGEEIIPCEYYQIFEFWGLIWVEDFSGKCGLINKKGKIIIPCEYKDFTRFGNGLIRVEDIHGKQGVINNENEGKIIIPCDYAFIHRVRIDETFPSMLMVKDFNDRWGLINLEGVVLYTCKYKDMYSGEYNYIIINNNNEFGLLDRNGKELTPCIYNRMTRPDLCLWDDHLMVQSLENKWGIINLQGIEVAPCIYDSSFDLDKILKGIKQQ